MCQVGEDYGEPVGEFSPRGPPCCEQKCVKCKTGQPVVVIRAGDAFCRDCFRAFYTHKFRAVLGKNRLIFPKEKVLLAWSGGASSSSMVWQVLEGLSRDSAKRLRFVPGVVYVDEAAACGQSPEARVQALAEVKRFLEGVPFPSHIVALEEVFLLPPSVLRRADQELEPMGPQGAYKAAVDSFLQHQQAGGSEVNSSAAPGKEPQAGACLPPTAQTEALCKLLNSVTTLTAKEELLQMLRTHLILHVARTHGYSKVMVGDSCTRLAIRLMTGLALGRGAFLAWDTGFSDERFRDVVVVRPMREHTLKEVAFYNRLFSVPSVFTPTISTKAPDKSSIHRLVEDFLLELQEQFPSTVSTVYRTSEKLLKGPKDGCAATLHCLLCLCPLDLDPADSATAFGAQTLRLFQPPSVTLSTEPFRSSSCLLEAGATQDCCSGFCERDEPGALILEQLCYSCRVTMKDLPSLDPLPPYILAEAQLRSQRCRCSGSLGCSPKPGATQETQEHRLDSSDRELAMGRVEPQQVWAAGVDGPIL
ncbi:cytoplasmic tRNA 2-thiolation protein 2 [Suncus etruscus]|uniref:cytoplasmic tRNA 2-thiolation protein 2 n=1 Tax=Suncus etruscus TaxID=109475 RepID=UPI002110AEC7|nr:cytoplasmic tRNA 2-thiolation protein 2 [Suncus etruscus]